MAFPPNGPGRCKECGAVEGTRHMRESTFKPGDRVQRLETFGGEVVAVRVEEIIFDAPEHAVLVRWDTHFGHELMMVPASELTLERSD